MGFHHHVLQAIWICCFLYLGTVKSDWQVSFEPQQSQQQSNQQSRQDHPEQPSQWQQPSRWQQPNQQGRDSQRPQPNQQGGNRGSTKQPNIIFFLADDLGYADLGYTGNPQIYTPTIDKYAREGVIFNRLYAQATCTPGRGALLTGKNIFRIGLQDLPIDPGCPYGLPLNETIMSTHFRNLGYEFYGLGKWHLGDYSRNAYPTRRGFSSWFGYMGMGANYYNYSILNIPNKITGLDLRADEWLVKNITGQFIGELLTERAAKTIFEHDANKPFFMYFSSPFPHVSFSGTGDSLHTTYKHWSHPAVQAIPAKYYTRRRHIANLIAMDMQFKNLIEELEWKGVLDNTIIVFQSDNGGDTMENQQPGSNWPLRGAKTSNYEGGARVLSFMWSPLLNKRVKGTQSDMLFHVTDWLPTLYKAANGDVKKLGDIDGVEQWSAINSGSRNGNRDTLLLNAHTVKGKNIYGVIQRDGNQLFKLIEGQVQPPWSNKFFQGWDTVPAANISYTDLLRQNNYRPFVQCMGPEGKEITPCDLLKGACLFELNSDPCEQNNIVNRDPQRAAKLFDIFKRNLALAIPPTNKPFDPKSNPNLYGGAWVPWLDANPVDPPDSPWMISMPPFDQPIKAKTENA